MRLSATSTLVFGCSVALGTLFDPFPVANIKPVPLPSHQQRVKVTRAGPARAGEKVDEKAEIAAFEKYFTDKLQSRGIPGMLYAVVRQNTTVAASGLGVLNITSPSAKVNADTLFNVGSVTKSLTATLLGTLVDEGKLNFTDRINTVFPGFALKDPLASGRCTFVDALTHVTGLPRYDAIINFSDGDTVDEFIARFKYLEPSADFRTTFQYNSLMYGVAGQAAAKLANASSYDDAIKARVFDKVGMTRAVIGRAAATRGTNVAAPHSKDSQNKTVVLPEYHESGLTNPGGAAFLNANDAAMYLRMLLNKGKAVTPAGDRVVSEKTLAEIFKARSFSDRSVNMYGGSPGFSEDVGYGFGWFKGTFRGHRFIYHSGGVAGFVSLFALFPDDDLAVAASVNSMSDFLAGSAVLDLADRFFGTHDTDWVAAMDQGMARLEKMKKPQPPVAKGTKPSRPLDSYAGSYLHKGVGTIKISVAASNQTAPLNAHLPGKANTEPCPLAHKQYDSFECSADGYVIPVSFIASDASSQTFDKINVQFEPAVMETLFTRV